MITDAEISFVVQGPVQATEGRAQNASITKQCLDSIRHWFPESTIILSTWKNQNLEGLDFDQLLELDDPGQNTVYNNDEAQKLNNNRQLFSTNQGLQAVKTPYAVKIRTDNKLVGRQFVEIYQDCVDAKREEKSVLFAQRVLTSSAFFITHHRGEPNYFCKSDLFDFGRTDDLLKIWSEILLDDQYFYHAEGYKSRPPATEQFLCLKWISEITGKSLHINNRVNDDAGLGWDYWNQCIANNLIVATPEELGLDVTERFYQRGNLVFEIDLQEWKVLTGIEAPTLRLKTVIKSFRNRVEKFNRMVYNVLKNK